MPGDATFLAALVTALQADVGVGSLVALTTHTASDWRISRGKPPKKGDLPFLGVNEYPSTPLVKEHTFIKRYIVSLAAYAAKDVTAIMIADRVEVLVHRMGGSNKEYFDFSTSEVTVYSTLFKGRVKANRDEDTDAYKEEIIIEILSNPFAGC